MSQLLETFDLLTLADAAELLHCSKAHICKAVSGTSSRVPTDSGRFTWPQKAHTQRVITSVDREQ